MTVFISILFLFSLIFPSIIQCQSGTFNPIIGPLDSFEYIPYYRMISESGCISVCLEYTSPLCYAVSYESFGQECWIITESVPLSFIPNQSLPNWRSYILTRDS